MRSHSAFGNLSQIAKICAPRLAENGRIVAMKAEIEDDETKLSSLVIQPCHYRHGDVVGSRRGGVRSVVLLSRSDKKETRRGACHLSPASNDTRPEDVQGCVIVAVRIRREVSGRRPPVLTLLHLWPLRRQVLLLISTLRATVRWAAVWTSTMLIVRSTMCC